MNMYEEIFFWFAVFFYMTGFISLLINVLFKKNLPFRIFTYSLIVGFTFHTFSIITRWVATGHPPVLSGYENSIAGAWFIIFLGLLLFIRFKTAGYFFLFLLPAVLLLLGNGLMSGTLHEALKPSFKSPWLGLHVIFAWLAFGSFVISAGISLYYLLLYFKIMENGEEERLKKLDEINLRLIGFGFISHTVMTSAGAIWAYGLWGSYWSWDPVETWSLITWLAYGLNIHLQLTMNWRGVRAQVLTLLCLIAVVITFFGLGLIHQFHIRLL